MADLNFVLSSVHKLGSSAMSSVDILVSSAVSSVDKTGSSIIRTVPLSVRESVRYVPAIQYVSGATLLAIFCVKLSAPARTF